MNDTKCDFCDFCECCNEDDKTKKIEVFVGYNETPSGYYFFNTCETHVRFYCVMCKFITWKSPHIKFDDKDFFVCMDCAKKILKLHM